MRIELCNLLKQYFPSIKLNIILVNHHTIGSLIKHKETLNKGIRSAVAYVYQCPKCGAQSVGSTIRNLSTRAAEHAEVSVKAASHDGQKLVITTSKHPATWRRRCLDHSHILGKKAIIFPSFDAGANGQLIARQCQFKIVLKFCQNNNNYYDKKKQHFSSLKF